MYRDLSLTSINTRIVMTLTSCVFIAILSTTQLHAAGKLYKWIDENGQIRYSDRLPPSQSSERFQMLAPDGRVVSTKEKSKTPAQLRAEREEQKRIEQEARQKAEEEARILAEQKHHDDVLMLTFSNEAEIGEAKDARVEVIDSVITLLKKDIEIEQSKLQTLKKRAMDKYLSLYQKVPGGLAQNIEYSEAKIKSKNEQMQVKLAEREKVLQQYEEDLVRYRELKSMKKSSKALPQQ